MSSPLPGNPHINGTPVAPKNPDDWPGQPSSLAIRKLSSFSEILTQAFTMPWRQTAVLLVWAVLAPAVASFTAEQLMNALLFGSASGTGLGARNPLSTVGFGLLGLLFWFVYLCVVLATSAFVPAFAAENIRSRFLGYRPSAREIWSGISRVVWRILGYTALMGLIVGVGLSVIAFVIALMFGVLFAITSSGAAAMIIGLFLAAVIITGLAFLIWFATKFIFVPSAMVFEGATIMGAISRSWQLTKGRIWRTFGIVLVIALAFGFTAGAISLLLGGGLTSGFSSFTDTSSNPLSPYDFSMFTVLSDAITTPITALGALGTAIASTLLYLDARSKTERLDLTLENWQNGINQGIPSQQMGYPFATPVTTPVAMPPAQGWQQP